MDLVRAERSIGASSGETLMHAGGERTVALLRAHKCLQRARADLDDAMQTEAADAAADRMATPALLGLLLDAVAARRRLDEVEAGLGSESVAVSREPRHLVSVARDPWP
jgi:hypothetical protein